MALINGSRAFVFWVGMSLIVAAWTGGALAAEETGYVFRSEEMRLTAYFGGEMVRLVISDGRELVLPQTISASGARFADGDTVFWNKGNEAYFDLGGASYTLRIVDADTDVWLRAQRDGVVFRAVGQEPGWLVEIHENNTIYVLLNYGDTVITTPLAVVEQNLAERTHTYRTGRPLSPLDVIVSVHERRCYDSMSGEGFTHAVTVEFPGTKATYVGCGRFL